MLKVIDPVRWEAAKAIFAAAFSSQHIVSPGTAFAYAEELADHAIECGWLADVPDEPQPPTTEWRPISEAAGSEVELHVGAWTLGHWSHSLCQYQKAVECGYTHYLPIPEPPAMEDKR